MRFGSARAIYELLKAVRIELPRRHLQHIAARARDQRVAPQRLPQLRNVALQRLGGRLRAILSPELVNQAVARDELVRLQEQDRQQLALPAAADGL
jgi:hypothetical protein